MGMFGKGFDWKAAAIAFANPQAGALYAQKRDQQLEYSAEMAAKANAHGMAMQALIARGVPREAAATIASDTQRAAAFLGGEFETKQFTSQGGSLARFNPQTGKTETTYQAPWRDQVGESIIGADANGGAPKTIYQGVRPVAVDGVGVFGMTGDGRVIGSNSGYNPYSPNADDDEYEYLPRQGGAGSQAPRPFRGGFNPYIPR